MQVYVRKRRRNTSPVLILTHALCFLIGFSACYVISRPSGQGETTTPPETQEATAPGTSTPETGAIPDIPPSEESALPASEVSTPAPVAGVAASGTATEANPGETQPQSPVETVAHPEDVWPARRLFVKVKGTKLDEASREFLGKLKPGGVVLQGDNIEDKEQTIALVAEIKQAVGLGSDFADLPLIAVDQEGGLVNRLKLDPAPSAADLAKQRNLDAVREAGKRYAQECKERGIAIILAPVMDVYEPGAEKSMETRSFGRNSKLVTAMGLAFADGVMSGGVLSIAKHYPGHGVAKEDSHVALAVTQKNGTELAKVAVPFIKAAERNIPGIMVGHVAAPAIDLEEPLRPASLSPVLVKTIFRDRYRYDGVIITDDIAMGAITGSRTLEEAAVQALNAGCDAVIALEPNPQRVFAVCDAIDQAAQSGNLPQVVLQDSARRLDAWQAWLRNPSGLKQPLPDLSDVPEEEPISAQDAIQPQAPPTEEEPAQAPPGTKKIVYTIKAGDSLTKIAKAHGVNVDDITKWNQLDGRKILSGSKLTIYVQAEDEGQEPFTPPQETPEATKESTTEDALTEEKPDEGDSNEGSAEPDSAAPDTAADSSEQPSAEAETYTLVAGDTLGKVAARLNVPLNKLAEFNGIDDPTKLHVGQKIKIPKP